MQVTTMIIFLAVWLLIFWLGSIFLEATGMDRSKARFQALSAMSGTGFTTLESESVVNHPKRRKIVAWLIFIGNAGIIAFIMFMILYVKAGLEAPSRLHIGIILGCVLFFVLVMKFVDKPTGAIVRLISSEYNKSNPGRFHLWTHYGNLLDSTSRKPSLARLVSRSKKPVLVNGVL